MARKRHDAAQIIAKLREAEVELARGKKTGEICRKLGITEQTYSATSCSTARSFTPCRRPRC